MKTRQIDRHVVAGLLWLGVALLSHGGEAQSPPTETLTFNAAADGYVDASVPASNFDTDAHLRAGAAPECITYLRFTLAGLAGRPVQQAKVRLQVNSTATDSGGTIHRISDNAWDEATLTYDNRPAVDGPGLSSLGMVDDGMVVEFDLGSAISHDGVYSFAIDSASTNGVSYESAASPTGQPPILLVTVASGPAPTVNILQPPDLASFFVGDPVTLQGTATDAVGTDLAATLSWRSDIQGPLGTGASLSPTLVEGTHAITASATDSVGLTSEALVHVSVTPRPHVNTPPLVAITAPPAARAFTAGTPVQFTGTANDLEDGDLTGHLAWTSDRDGALGTGASFTKTLSAGTHHITARATDSGPLTGSADVTVVIETPPTLEVVPSADAYVDSAKASKNFGTTTILSVDANSVRNTYLRFAVSGIGTRPVLRAVLRLQVDATSVAPSPGGGTVHTIGNTTWQEKTITFANRPAVDGPAFGSVGAVMAGQVVEFDVTGAVTRDGTYNLAITSSSTDNADYRSRETATPPKLVLTLGANAPVVAILAPPNQSAVFAGAPVTFTGRASDVEDGDVSAGLQWSSNLDGGLGTGATVASSSLRVGTHTIVATVADSAGHPGQAQASLRVRGPNAAPTVTIGTPADGGSTPAGTPVTLAATASDDFDPDPSSQIHWSSSLDGDLGTGSTRTVVLHHEGRHTLTAAATDSDGATGGASVGFSVMSTPPVVAITAPAEGTTVFQGTALVFTGSAPDVTDGNLAAALHWTSSRDGHIGDGASFSTATLTVGSHVVTARAEDAGGLAGEATRTVIVRAPNMPPVVTIQAPTDGAALLTGKPVLLVAQATDAEDGDLATRVRWSSNRSGLLGTGGTLTVPTLPVGSHTLTAAVTDRDGATVSASVNVAVSASALTFLPVADTYVDSGTPTKAYGTATGFLAGSTPVRQGYLRFQVTGVGSFAVERAILRLTAGTAKTDAGPVGGTIQGMSNTAAWSEATTTYNTRPAVSGPILATRTTAIKAGQVVDFDVTAGLGVDGSYNFALVNANADWVKYQSREGSKKPQLLLTLKQNTSPMVSITAPAAGTVSSPGAPVTFTATATDAESGNLSAQIRWSSDRDGALGSGGTLTVTSLSPGAHTVTARVTDPSGASASATTTVVVDNPPVVAFSTPADHTIVFTTAGPLTLGAMAIDVEDGDLTGDLQWMSSLDGPLGTGGMVSRALTIGTHTITAAVRDARGVPGQAQIMLRVRGPNAAPVVTITGPPTDTAVDAGTPVTLTATARDDFDGDLGAQIAWTSSLDGPLGAGPSRTLTLHHEGPHTLTAAVTDSDGTSASAAIIFTVRPTPPAVTIDAPTVGAVLFANNAITFAGTATDATDGDLSAALVWTSDLSGPIGTGAHFTTMLGMGTHTVTAQATDAGSLATTATRIVVVKPPDIPPTLTIEAPTDGVALFAGRPLLLAAHAMDAEDGDLGTAIHWSSSLDGFLGTGAMLTATTLSPGAHLVTATVTDHDGASASASVSVVSSPTTLTFLPVADTYVDSANAASTFGTATSLAADTSPDKQTYLRFVVSGITPPFTVRRARLRLTAGSASTASSPVGGELHAMTNGTWSEAATTYANRPAVDGPTRATQGAVSANQVVEFDLTEGLHGDGVYNFGLLTTSADDVIYQSREATTGRPQLVIDLRGPDDPVLTITAPANGAQISFGQSVSFGATVSDLQDGDLSPQIHWTDSIDGPLGIGTNFVRTLSPGTHTIAATVTDSSHTPASATVVVTVTSSGNVGFRDFTYPSSVGTAASNEATAQKPEAHLWFYDHTWWATLYSASAGAHRMHRLDRVTQRWIDTGVFIDERPLSRQDCMMDGDKLYMASRTGYLASGTNRLLRFSYEPVLKTWFLDPGFPVTLPGGGTESLTLAKDSTGRFWVAYTWNSTVYVANSLQDDMHWAAPFVLPATQGLPIDADDIAGVIALDGKIGVFYTNQRTGADYFAVHPDAAAPTAGWTTEVAVAGNKAADDHFNMKLAADGRLWVVMKTSRTGSSDILVGLLVRSTNGTWSPMYNVGSFGQTWGTRGLVQLDDLHRRVYVFYSPFHQTIYYKTTDMDTISLQSGLGIPFITSTSVNDINNPSGTKQSVTPESGIVVIASSPGDLSYWHNTVPIFP